MIATARRERPSDEVRGRLTEPQKIVFDAYWFHYEEDGTIPLCREVAKTTRLSVDIVTRVARILRRGGLLPSEKDVVQVDAKKLPSVAERRAAREEEQRFQRAYAKGLEVRHTLDATMPIVREAKKLPPATRAPSKPSRPESDAMSSFALAMEKLSPTERVRLVRFCLDRFTSTL